MTLASALVLAFLNGLSVAAASGYFIQWMSGAEAGFRPPFVTHRHMARSLAITIVAGPFLLMRELWDAWHTGGVSRHMLGVGAVIVPLWMTATGIVVLSLSEQVVRLAGAFNA